MLLRIKWLKIGSYGLVAILIIAFATLLRLSLIAWGWPHSNSDEGTMGLMAMHILSKGEHPIFFYGQNYMGSLEAYVGAIFFSLFGPSVFALRLGSMVFFALFLVNMYLLTSLLFSKKLALITLIILSLGSSIMLDTELVALGGYPELLFFGSLSLLLASWLAISYDRYLSPHRELRRLLAFACWGLVSGIGFWSDFLMLDFIVLSGLFLLLFCWKELVKGAFLFLVSGLVVGSIPLIIYNLKAPPNLNTLAVLKYLHNNGDLQLAQMHYHGIVPFWPQLRGTLLTTLPAAIGGSPFCFDAYTHFRLAGYLGSENSSCSIISSNSNQISFALIWSLGFIVLWTTATILTLKHILVLNKGARDKTRTSGDKYDFVRYAARLMLLCSAALTLYLFTSSPVAAAFPNDSRYLIGLLISTPVLIWPLWDLFEKKDATESDQEEEKHTRFAFKSSMLQAVWKRGLLALICIALLIGTYKAFLEIPDVQSYNKPQQALIHELAQLKISHFYTEYWTCDTIAFLSNEHLICTSIDNALRPHYNRYRPYITTVTSDPNSAYVLPLGASQIAPLEKRIAHTKKKYQRFVVDGYIIFKPA